MRKGRCSKWGNALVFVAAPRKNMAPLQVPWIGDFSESPTSRYSGIKRVTTHTRACLCWQALVCGRLT